MKLTRNTAQKILTIVDQGLVSGLGTREPGKMCVEAAICYALDLPHGDNPGCVAECIRRYKIRLNDSPWSSDAARAIGMRRPAIAQLGSKDIDQKMWRDYVVEQTIRRIVPEALRAAALRCGNIIHKDGLVAAALRCANEGTVESAQNGRKVAYAADAAGGAYAAAYAAASAANDAYAAASAANDAYAAYAAAYAAASAERDRVLTIGAEICVEACILVKTQGSEWLDLCD